MHSDSTVSYTHLARALSRESKIECFAGKEQTGVLSFRVPGTPSEVLADMLSDEGVCTRAGLHCARAVSYTHLDVYKRQSPNRSSPRVMRTGDEVRVSGPVSSASAVS